jgi:hypothetical protein
MNLSYIKNFTKERSGKIGSSDIPALLQHPETSESLAGYDRTALTVYQEKRGEIEREEAGYKAHMGHMLEPIAIHEFIRKFEQIENPEKTATEFLKGYYLCELNKKDDGYPLAEESQFTDFYHHTTVRTDFGIAHADCFYVPTIPAENEPAIIEAKTRGFWPVKRDKDPYKGYDFTVTSHQGIPLSDFYQVQYQLALYQEVYGIRVDNAYLALLYDTNSFATWHIKSNRRAQERLLELADYLHKCIKKGTPPKKLAMSQSDIKIMYPKLEEDFVTLSGEELDSAITAAKQSKEAQEQEKMWKQKKEDALNTLSVFLKDNKKIKGLFEGELIDLAEWQERSGSERVAGVKEIKKDEEFYNILKEKGFINVSEDSRFVKVKFKGE